MPSDLKMKGSKQIRIGTSGWNYDHWRGPFYPEDLPHKKWLDFYCKRFKTVEVNNSFYQLPSEKTFESWRENSPSGFIFAVKASRYITHMKKLNDPKDALKNFFKRVEILGDKLGPVLFQLPPRWKSNPGRLKSFLKLLSKDYRYTFEFRDQSWWNEEIYQILSEYNAAFCIFELAGEITPKEITANFIYIRLHGPGDKYQGQYDGQTLGGWAGAFANWSKKVKTIYCYFDNDQNGYAAQDAQRLQEMVK